MIRFRAADHGLTGKTTPELRAIDLVAMGGLTQRQITQEGLVAPANISKVGVQWYRAGELGIPGMDAMTPVYAFRPSNEVFDPEAVKSFQLSPLANDHPPDDVTPANWRKYASEGRIAGDIRDVAPADDGKHLTAKLIVRDKKAIDDIAGGKSQLSCGYTFDADWTPGEFEGQHYDFVQRRIRGNHVAIVDVARGGYGCRIADRDPTTRSTHMEPTIMTVPVTINGITFRVIADDSANAIAVRDAYDKMSALHKAGCDAATEMRGHFDAMKAHHKAVVERLSQKDDDEDEEGMDGKKKGKDSADLAPVQMFDEKLSRVRSFYKKTVAAEKQKAADAVAKIPTEAQIDGLVAAKHAVVAGATKLIGDGFKADGKTIGAIRVEALTHVIAKDEALKAIAAAVLGGTDLSKPENASAPLVIAAFDAVVAQKGASKATDGGNSTMRSILAHDGRGAGSGGGAAAADLRNPDAISRSHQASGGRIPGQSTTA